MKRDNSYRRSLLVKSCQEEVEKELRKNNKNITSKLNKDNHKERSEVSYSRLIRAKAVHVCFATCKQPGAVISPKDPITS